MYNLQTPINLLEGRSFRKGKFYIATSNYKPRAASVNSGRPLHFTLIELSRVTRRGEDSKRVVGSYLRRLTPNCSLTPGIADKYEPAMNNHNADRTKSHRKNWASKRATLSSCNSLALGGLVRS